MGLGDGQSSPHSLSPDGTFSSLVSRLSSLVHISITTITPLTTNNSVANALSEDELREFNGMLDRMRADITASEKQEARGEK